MKTAINSVKSATTRLREHYPKALAQCSEQAIAYAHCLDLNDIQNVKKHACNEQFMLLKQCFQAALKNVH
ncbi:hypothetical protein TYRP_020501 [Tyrophagus putrescentiae]|nr:hypothetical protein TYRP_020501 [Tyrophagus putrescentiae]